jgi:hypothetical protein
MTSGAEAVSMGVPPASVVEVIVKFPGHTVLGIWNRKDFVSEVPAGIVNAGVVNITLLELLVQEGKGPSGPVKVN